MKSSRVAMASAGISVAAVAVALSTPAVGLPGKNTVDGGDIENNSVTGKDIKEKTLKAVPSAHALSPLGSGKSQSGIFSAAGANSSGAGGWLGVPVNYPRPLATDIADDHIVDAYVNPTPNCPGPGQAAPGYLCIYNEVTSGTEAAYGYSELGNLPSPSIGVIVYFPVDGADPYVGGSWTVTAP